MKALLRVHQAVQLISRAIREIPYSNYLSMFVIVIWANLIAYLTFGTLGVQKFLPPTYLLLSSAFVFAILFKLKEYWEEHQAQERAELEKPSSSEGSFRDPAHTIVDIVTSATIKPGVGLVTKKMDAELFKFEQEFPGYTTTITYSADTCKWIAHRGPNERQINVL